MENSVEVIVGTYDDFLLGFKIVSNAEGNLKALTPTFSVRSHTSSIRCLAVGGKYLATGSADDKIFIYDMQQRKEINILLHHFNAVNALTFTPDGSHLISGGSDGRMYVTRVGNWRVGAEWKKAHGGAAITNIACHSSSKLAMSLGSDFTFRTWNLVTGRCAYVTNLKTKKNLQNIVDCLQYSPESKHFAMTGNRIVEIWNFIEAKIVKEVLFNARPISICWLTKDHLVVGLQTGKLGLVSINDAEVEYFTINKSRIKSIAYVNNILAICSSNGDITICNIDLRSKQLNKIVTHNIGCRPTCITLLNLNQFDENYQLNKITDSLSDEEIGTDKELHREKPNKVIGSVTIEYDNDNENVNDSFLKEEINEKSDKLSNKKKKTLRKRSTKSIDEDSKNKVASLRKRKVSLDNSNKKSMCVDYSESSASSDDQPLIPKKNIRTNYVTPLDLSE